MPRASESQPRQSGALDERSTGVVRIGNASVALQRYGDARAELVKTSGVKFSFRRAVSPENLPDVFIANPLGAAKGEDHDAAKAGDVAAAVRLASKLVTPELLDHLRAVAPADAVVVGVTSVEATGKNALPEAAAEILAHHLGLSVDSEILQTNRPHRTALSGLDRIFSQPEFGGPVEPGAAYVLVDDTLTQGGTFAALASHIEQGGGLVVVTVALTGKQYSRRLRLDEALLQRVRDAHGDVEDAFRQATGYGFDGLTASEARYLAGFQPADAVRNRILAEAQERAEQTNPGDLGEG